MAGSTGACIGHEMGLAPYVAQKVSIGYIKFSHCTETNMMRKGGQRHPAKKKLIRTLLLKFYKMKIKLLYEDVPILVCDQVSGLPSGEMDEEGYYQYENSLLGFFNIKILNPIKVKKRKGLQLIHFYNDVVFDEFHIQTLKAIDFGSWQSEYHSALFECENSFDFLKIEILRTWIAGNTHVGWKDFDSSDKSSSWLRACFEWRGLPEKNQVLNQEIEIFSKEVKNVKDLFCMLGEAVYGYGGYIGQCLTGFDECITYIARVEKKPLIIMIHDYKELERILDDQLPDNLYRNYFFETLERAGCVVIK